VAALTLRRDLNIGSTWLLPEWSTGPRGDELAVLEAAREAGYQGIQGADAGRCRDLGLVPATSDIRPTLGGLAKRAQRWADQGYECATLMLGTGLEGDDAIDQFVEEVLEASAVSGLPLFIETHRATITQDIWRTLQIVDRFPEVRFNGDFSHWYVSHDLGMAGFDDILEVLRPVLDRVRYLHGRVASSGCIQVPVDASSAEVPPLSHFVALWEASFEGAMRTSGDDRGAGAAVVGFAPELLPGEFGYAPLITQADGSLAEASDRWEQALVLTQIATQCFDRARRRRAGGEAPGNVER
jgi:hypothetical protein